MSSTVETSTKSKPAKRYSDTKLGEFKVIVEKKLKSARKELKYLRDQLQGRAEVNGDLGDRRFNEGDGGSNSSERTYLNEMAGRQLQSVKDLEAALVRIETKTYGICAKTGNLIREARLRAVPGAILSIEAEKANSK